MEMPVAASRKENILLGYAKRLSELKLFARNRSDLDAWQTIAWWESRRIPYNLVVGTAGVISSALCLITGILCEHFLGDPFGIPDPPIFAFLAVAAYGVMANLCYTGGWLGELLVRRLWPAESNAFGKLSFFLGLNFSIFLTLAPGFLVSLVGALRLSAHFLAKWLVR